MKRLYNNKYISIRDGNISFKPKNENFYISAGSVQKNNLNEDQVIKVNFENKKILNKEEYPYNLTYNKNLKYKPSENYIHIYKPILIILIKIFLLFMLIHLI